MPVMSATFGLAAICNALWAPGGGVVIFVIVPACRRTVAAQRMRCGAVGRLVSFPSDADGRRRACRVRVLLRGCGSTCEMNDDRRCESLLFCLLQHRQPTKIAKIFLLRLNQSS